MILNIILYVLMIAEFSRQLCEILPVIKKIDGRWDGPFGCYFSLTAMYMFNITIGWMVSGSLPVYTLPYWALVFAIVGVLLSLYNRNNSTLWIPMLLGFVHGMIQE